MHKTKNEIINVKRHMGEAVYRYNGGNNERKSMVKRSEHASRSVKTRRECWERAGGAPEVMRARCHRSFIGSKGSVDQNDSYIGLPWTSRDCTTQVWKSYYGKILIKA